MSKKTKKILIISVVGLPILCIILLVFVLFTMPPVAFYKDMPDKEEIAMCNPNAKEEDIEHVYADQVLYWKMRFKLTNKEVQDYLGLSDEEVKSYLSEEKVKNYLHQDSLWRVYLKHDAKLYEEYEEKSKKDPKRELKYRKEYQNKTEEFYKKLYNLPVRYKTSN